MSAVFKWLAQRGFAVCSYDIHGHGRSEPLDDNSRTTFHDFNHVMDDAQQHLLQVAEPLRQSKCPDAPLFLCGASLGGAVVRKLVLLALTCLSG